jgi:two-component system, cell cycle sensor histidine kinase and response regulator CckA
MNFPDENDRLEHQDKLVTIGQISAGIAHDFNNLLGIILNYTELMAQDIDKDSPLHESLSEIRNATERAVAVTRQLLIFSRRQVMKPELIDLFPAVKNLEKLLRKAVPENVDFKITNDCPEPAKVFLDPSALMQLLLNLVTNARDAMPKGGKLELAISHTIADKALLAKHPEMSLGTYVVLSVTDTGIGMNDETMAKIFEPFFTTKDPMHGTGLGLSTVYGIVKRSKGYVWVDSKPGEGSVFRVYLLCAGCTSSTVAIQSEAVAKSRRTILVTEDEDAFRKVIRMQLVSAGYNVIEARTPLEALEVASDSKNQIHLLITDVIMPRMSGKELAVKITEIRKCLPVLFMSGYPDSVLEHHDILDSKDVFLKKPFTGLLLLSKVEEILKSDDFKEC